MDNCTCTSRERVYIVYGNDFTIEAHVSVYDKDEGIYKLLDLTGVKECQMRLVGTYRKAIGKDITVTGSKVTAFFPGGSVGVGTYGVEITFVDSLGKGRIFERNLIGIVSASGEATVDNDTEGETGEGLNVSVNVLTRTVRIGGTGATDYPSLTGKPSINGVVLEGNRTPEELGMYSKGETDEKFETKEKAASDLQAVTGAIGGKVDKVAGKGLSKNDYTDEDKAKVRKALQEETDPTVPGWAKAPTKPAYTAKEVGALPDTTKIPTKVSELENDKNYLTEQSLAGYAKEADLAKVATSGKYEDLSGKPTILAESEVRAMITTAASGKSDRMAYEAVSGDTPSVTLALNKVVECTSEAPTSVAVSLPSAPTSEADRTLECVLRFRTGASAPTVSFPAELRWAGGEVMSIEASTCYEFSVVYCIDGWNIIGQSFKVASE